MSARRGVSPGAASTTAVPPAKARTAPAWVKILVGLHVFATVVWALPKLPQGTGEGAAPPHATQWLLYYNEKYLKPLAPIQIYLLSTGAWQYWDMFAPDPAFTDWYCTAEVTFKDGKTRVVDYPRMSALPLAVKYVKERYRKFYERAHDDQAPRVWPSFAQAMALRVATDPNDPPTIVKVRRHWLIVEPPGKPQPTDYKSYVYYSYVVDQAWLRKAARWR